MDYYLMIKDNDGNIAFYDENARTINNFRKDIKFEYITKPKVCKYSSLSLEDAINKMVFVLNKFFFLDEGYIIKIENNKNKLIFRVKRKELREFINFYKGDTDEK